MSGTPKVRLRSVALVWGAAIGYTLLWSALGPRLIGVPAPPRRAVVEAVVLLVVWAAVTPVILRSAARLPLRRKRLAPVLAAHLALATSLIFALNLIGPLASGLLVGEPLPLDAVWHEGIRQFAVCYHLALPVYALILGVGYYLHAQQARRAERLRAERLRADLAEAQLRALRLQLEPHFLFNALNALGSLILTGRQQDAFEATGQLGDLFRAMLAADRRPEVALQEELELTAAYVAIEQLRLGERLRLRWEIADGLSAAQLPPFLLQPLVENAVRHGIGRRTDGGRLIVRADAVGERLRLEVADDGAGIAEVGRPQSRGGGIGLDNTRRRLAHLYGDAQRLELARSGEWTCVRVELPLRLAGPPAAEAAA
jgi:hypothetical protein